MENKRNDLLRKEKLNQIIEKYQNLVEKENRIPVVGQFTKAEISLITEEYGSFSELKYVLIPKYKLKTLHGNKWIADEKLIDEIRKLHNQLGYPPRQNQYKRSATAMNRFGGPWSNVLNKCGIKATFKNNSRVSKEEIIAKTQKAIDKAGELPKWDNLKNYEVPVGSILTYWNNFDDFAKEFNLRSRREQVYLKQVTIYGEAIKKAAKLGRPITQVEFLKLAQTTRETFLSYLNKEVIRGNLETAKPENYFKKHGIPFIKKEHGIVIYGERYPSLELAAKKLGITNRTLKKRIKEFGPNSPLLGYKGNIVKENIVKIGDKVFPGIKNASKELGINYITLKKRLAYYGHGDLNKILSPKILYPAHPGQPVVVNGKTYKNMTIAANSLHMNRKTLLNRLKVFGHNDSRAITATTKEYMEAKKKKLAKK